MLHNKECKLLERAPLYHGKGIFRMYHEDKTRYMYYEVTYPPDGNTCCHLDL